LKSFIPNRRFPIEPFRALFSHEGGWSSDYGAMLSKSPLRGNLPESLFVDSARKLQPQPEWTAEQS